MFLQISGRLLTPLNYSSALSNNNKGRFLFIKWSLFNLEAWGKQNFKL